MSLSDNIFYLYINAQTFREIMKFFEFKNVYHEAYRYEICSICNKPKLCRIARAMNVWHNQKRQMIHINLFIHKSELDYYIWINNSMCMRFIYTY